MRDESLALNLLVVIPTLNDDPTDTINSILSQGISISKILVGIGSKILFRKLANANFSEKIKLIYVKPDFSKDLGTRVSQAINVSLKHVNLESYDYLLRFDADTVLPKNFLRTNLAAKPDLIGAHGSAMMLSIPRFTKLLNGKFPEVNSEDSYIYYLYQSHGFAVADLAIEPFTKRIGGSHYSWRQSFDMGISSYRLGYEPFHIFVGSTIGFRTNPAGFFGLFGYLSALIKRTGKHHFSNWLFYKQLGEFLTAKESLHKLMYLERLYNRF
jgi:hypothetical protein